MSEVIEIVTQETVVIDSPDGVELIVVEVASDIEFIEVAQQGSPGPPGRQGDPGIYDGAVADASPDPVLLFDNALI